MPKQKIDPSTVTFPFEKLGEDKFKVMRNGERLAYVRDNQTGSVEIVDPYGTFEQAEEPSYDIWVKGNPGCLFKHIRESNVVGLAE